MQVSFDDAELFRNLIAGSGTPTYVPYATDRVSPRTIVEVAKASN